LNEIKIRKLWKKYILEQRKNSGKNIIIKFQII